MQDSQTPALVKIMAALTVGYALSPIDLIPDFIPILGYLDDLILLPAMIMLTLKLIPEEVITRNRKKAEGMWAEGKPKKWIYAIPIIVIWIIVMIQIIKWIR